MKRRFFSHVLLFALSLSLASAAGLTSSAFAQGKKAAAKKATAKKAAAKPTVPVEGAGESDEAPAEQTKVKVERGSGGRKIYKIEGAIVIEGKIQKPEAFYVLQKSNINYDWHELKQEFVPKILDSVTKAPF